jgi:hypothetical protein
MNRFAKRLLVVAGILGVSGATLGAQVPGVSFDGTLGDLSATGFTLTLATGAQKVVSSAPSGVVVLDRLPSTIGDLKAGDALAITATRQDDGTLRASVINVFPASLYQRVRKGQFPMQNGALMTNAVVRTNVARVSDHVLTMELETGTSEITVPDTVKVTKTVEKRWSDLKNGIHVQVRGTDGGQGNLVATNVTLEP